MQTYNNTAYGSIEVNTEYLNNIEHYVLRHSNTGQRLSFISVTDFETKYKHLKDKLVNVLLVKADPKYDYLKIDPVNVVSAMKLGNYIAFDFVANNMKHVGYILWHVSKSKISVKFYTQYDSWIVGFDPSVGIAQLIKEIASIAKDFIETGIERDLYPVHIFSDIFTDHENRQNTAIDLWDLANKYDRTLARMINFVASYLFNETLQLNKLIDVFHANFA